MIAFDAALTRGNFVLDARFSGADGITALFGPSGSGKTTILSLIVGLLRPDRGLITLDDRELVNTETRLFVPSHLRRLGLVFQDAQLFPHLTVDQNLRFGRWFGPKTDRGLSFDAVVDTMGIGRLLSRRTPGLSGGEKQRVALARALLASPEALLMDEPLAGLDQDRKLEILSLIERMRDEFCVPIIYVTHSADEATRLASRVVKLNAGRVEAIGTPAEVLKSPTVSRASAPDGFRGF